MVRYLLLVLINIFICGSFIAPAFGATVVSLVAVLASPSELQGQEVSVSGVLGTAENGKTALYLDHGSYENAIAANGIAIITTVDGVGNLSLEQLQKLNGKYVFVVGTLDASAPKSLFSTRITQVKTLRSYPLLQALPSN